MSAPRMRAWTIVLAAALGGCPMSARKNARVEPGFDLELTGGAAVFPPGEDESGDNTTATVTVPQAELHLQYGAADGDGGANAIQLKIPFSVVNGALDLYHQFPSSDGMDYGVGGELGPLPGVYGAFTYWSQGGEVFLTLTPRLLTRIFDEEPPLILSPQISLGLRVKSVEISAYLNYTWETGRGQDIDYCFTCDDSSPDFRKSVALMGGALRF